MATRPSSRKASSTAKSQAPVPAVAPTVTRARVSFQVQRLEPQVALTLAAYALWAGVFLNPDGTDIWLVAASAAAISGWSRAVPAPHPVFMFLRAALLLGGGFLLHSVPGLGGPLGAWLMWPLAVATAYALLLPDRWAVPLMLLALATFALACAGAAPPPRWPAALVVGSVLAMLPALALAIGRALGGADQQAEQARVDRRSQLYNEDGFFVNGGALFDNCRRQKRPFSLLLLSGADLRDASDLLGKKAANRLFAEMVKGIAAATPPGGIAARTDAVEFALALPNLTAERAGALLRQNLGEPPKVEIDLDGAKATIVLDAIIAQASQEMHTLEDMYDTLHLRLRAQATKSQRPVSERSSLQGLLDRDPPMPFAQRPTLPMPLKGRPR